MEDLDFDFSPEAIVERHISMLKKSAGEKEEKTYKGLIEQNEKTYKNMIEKRKKKDFDFEKEFFSLLKSVIEKAVQEEIKKSISTILKK